MDCRDRNTGTEDSPSGSGPKGERRSGMPTKGKILVVDDEKNLREFLEIMLQQDGYEVETAQDGRFALEKMKNSHFDLVICDVKMPEVDGIEVLKKAKENWADTEVIMITAYASTETAVEAMKQGALDYITKPFKVDEIRIIIERAFERRTLERQNRLLKKQLKGSDAFPMIIGSSPVMQKMFALVEKIADTPTNVLITGESGTGKELVAKAIHNQSDRRDAPFVAIHCGAIPENLIESELFGHMKGSFTGAIQNKVGLLKMADGGTVFLDEVGEIPLQMQVKLLRVLQERTFRRVGCTEDLSVSVRIICATNKELEEEIEAGRFREDLYYRLNVIRIAMPSLRDRKGDIPLLAEHFVKKYTQELHRKITKISDEAMELLENYYYPGNVRELENILERAVALATTPVILAENLPADMMYRRRKDPGREKGFLPSRFPDDGLYLESIVEDLEKMLIQQALDRTHGVKKRAAELLHVSFRSFRYRLEKYAMNERDDAPDV
jgi:two-component system, NtrC family, response regulator PilR